MSHGLKLFLLAAGTIITLIVVTVSFNMAKQSRAIDRRYSESLNEFYNDIDSSDITMYDGVEVYGSDVVNFIKKKLSSYSSSETAPVKITVVTVVSPYKAYTYKNRDYIKDIQNFTNARYIKPLNKFVGSVIYNSNDVITEVIFTVK